MTIKQLNNYKIAIILLVLLNVFLVLGCSSRVEDLCLGKWSTDNGSAKIELFKDGTINIAEQGATAGKYLLIGGKYSFTDKDEIVIELYESKTIIKFSISGDELIWTYPNGEVLKYKREY